MTPRSVGEYLSALGPRYRRGSRAEKSRWLDEAERLTGYHRKSLIRRLRPARERPRRRSGRPPRYGDAALAAALVRLWEASDRACGKRLVPFLAELLAAMERHGEIGVSPEVRARLLTLSAATVDRRLAAHRRRTMQRPYAHVRASTPLLAAIPIRTFGEWQDPPPGSVPSDLVLHCGETTAGSYLATVVAVDVALGWTDFQGIPRLSVKRVKSGVHQIRGRWPVPLRELHSDNGAEFLNDALYRYGRDEGIRFTRGRPYKKNDQAWIEQKNWSAIRRVVGYDRSAPRRPSPSSTASTSRYATTSTSSSPSASCSTSAATAPASPSGYDEARTPYQRLIASRRAVADGRRSGAARPRGASSWPIAPPVGNSSMRHQPPPLGNRYL